MSNESEPDFPPEIKEFLEALSKLPGLYWETSLLNKLGEVAEEDLGLLFYTRLPLGALRRTNGGLPNEGIIQFEFHLEANEKGWKTLEFLAWFVRDMARASTAIQLRPFAMPPFAGNQVQLGHTLRFHMDLFFPGFDNGPEPAMRQVAEINTHLKLCLDLYGKYLYA